MLTVSPGPELRAKRSSLNVHAAGTAPTLSMTECSGQTSACGARAEVTVRAALTDHWTLTCGGVQTLQAPVVRQDPPQSAAQAASSSSHTETSVHHAIYPSTQRTPSV